MMVKKITLLLVFVTLFFQAGFLWAKTPAELQQEIANYEKEIRRLNLQSTTLFNQIAQYDAQIKLTTLRIEEIGARIDLIAGRITGLKDSVESLSVVHTQRVVEEYKYYRVDTPLLFFIFNGDLSAVLKHYTYLRRIQNEDAVILSRLTAAKDNYENQKKEQEKLFEQLKLQEASLANQKKAKANLLAITKNDEKRYQQLLTEANLQLAAIRRFVSGQGGASILQNQTVCNDWGCYYNQRDSQWGNIGLGGSKYSVAEYGCLVSSVAMVASHYGKNIKPSDIATNPSAFVPPTGYLEHSFSVNGVSVLINNASKNLIDSELASGRPVIAGLFSGPDHFIVLLKKDGDNYIMNDPFMENGHDKPLTDKYSFSNISSIRLVSFN